MSDHEPAAQNLETLNAYLRAVVERETRNEPVRVEGAISRVHVSQRGHIYFDLVDGDYSIRCMLRERRRGKINFTPQNGMEIEVSGVIALYAPRASIEIEIEAIRLLEQPVMTSSHSIEDRLAAKGLWPKQKRPLPRPIKHIGLVTSRHSDALHDFEYHYRDNEGQAKITLVDTGVQGEDAPREIANAIQSLNDAREVDVIVLTRGGGRVRDLAAYNDLLIAEAICRSTIPVATGIGHERDAVFADRAADFTAGTPTALAVQLAQANQAVPETVNLPAVWMALFAVSVALMVVAIAVLVVAF